MALFTSPKPTTEITFACREDRKAILAANASLEHPWPEADLGSRVGDCLTFGLVVYRKAALLGFAFYRQRQEAITLSHLATAPDSRRLGVAAALLREIQASLPGRRPQITAVVPDYALPAHLLFHKLGFRASGTVRGHFGDADGYVFAWPSEPVAAIGYQNAPEFIP